jgi:hypothetical protein
LHPTLFAILYYAADKPMELLGFFPQFRAFLIAWLPSVVQAFFAGVGDYYTWKLSEKMYGLGSNPAWATVSKSSEIVRRLLTTCTSFSWLFSAPGNGSAQLEHFQTVWRRR